MHRRLWLSASIALGLTTGCATSVDDGLGGAGGAGASSSSASSSKASSSSSATTSTTSTTSSVTSTTTVGTTVTATSSTDASSGTGVLPMGTCSTPTVIQDPSTTNGSTVGQADNETGSCQEGGASEVVYELTAAATGTLHVTLSSSADLGVYVQTTCGDEASEIGCVDDTAFSDEELFVPVTQGQTLYVIVDGYTSGEASSFSIDVASAPPTCGNNVVETGEQCDPPDMVTCDASCQTLPELCDDAQDNDGDTFTDCDDLDCVAFPACDVTSFCSAATTLGGMATMGNTTAGSTAFTGSCTGGGAHEVLYTFTPPSDGVLSLDLATTVDLGLYVRTTCGSSQTELACVDDSVTAESLDVGVTSGVPVTVFVDGYSATDMGAYTLTPTFTPLTETEPNGTSATADAFTSPFKAAIFPAGDNDWIAVTVPGPASSITAHVDDGGTTACEDNAIDSEVEIYAPNGTTSLAFNEDISIADYCSQATASNLAAGTYFVRASSSVMYQPDATFVYQLVVTVQ